MRRHDSVFYVSWVLVAGAVGLAAAGLNAGILLFVLAYLLRPILHEFGIATQYVDERELSIHSRSGNVAFIIVMLGAAGFMLYHLARGEEIGDDVVLLCLGVGVRALTGLILTGAYRRAGVLIITVVGLAIATFGFLDGGFSVPALVLGSIGLAIIGFGQIARRAPRGVGILLLFIAAAAVVVLRLYQLRMANLAMWMFAVAPTVFAASCLLLGGTSDDQPASPRTRSIVFGALATGLVFVFALLLLSGSRETRKATPSLRLPAGEFVTVQGIPCTGSIAFRTDGQLASCTLARDQTISGQLFPAGTVISFTPEGKLDWCFLQQDAFIQGVHCRGEGHGFMTCFHPNGRLRLAWLAQDETIRNIPCRKYSAWADMFGGGDGTSFYDDGTLQACRVNSEITIQQHLFRPGERVQFRHAGRWISTGNAMLYWTDSPYHGELS